LTRAPSEPIRVLRLIARLNVGGPALHVSYLSKELDEIGYETMLVAGRVGSGEGSMEYVPEELGVKPVYVDELRRDISPFVDTAAVRRIRSLIREFRPHVLHTHTAKAGAVGRTAAALSSAARPPVVVHTFHGHVLRGYFGSLHTSAFLQIERRLAAVSDALVAVSPEVRDDLVRLGVAPAERITVIRLGLELDRRVSAGPGAGAAVRAGLEIPEERFVVGWFGRMTEIKRVDDLLRSFARLRLHGVDSDLLLVGDGPLAPQLRTLASELGIAERTHFLGYREDVARLYAACDVVALTSANEGTPVSLIEGLAARRPAVSTDVGGVSDVVLDGESGLLVPAGDVAGLAAGFARLAGDPELRRAFGERGSEDVRSRYSVPRLVADVDHLYRSLLERAESAAAPTPAPEPISQPLPRTIRPRPGTPAADRALRVILVSQYFPPEIGATQSRMQSFAELLSDRGHQVTVICEFPNHPHGQVPEAYHGRFLEDDRANAYRILRVWVKADPKKTQSSRLAFYLSFMGLATAVAPRAGRADVVVATTPPLFTGLAGLAIARMNRAPFVLDVRDLWPAAATSLRQISPGWATSTGESLERRLYRSAAAVSAVTRPFCEHIDAIRGDGSAAVLIPNGTLEQFFVDGEPAEADRLGVPADRFLVTFAGTIGIAQAIPSVLEAAGRLSGVADFAFIGDGPVKPLLVEEAERLGLENVRFHPQMPLERIPPILAASDALLVPLSAHPTFQQFVPSKLIDSMAAGRPVLLAAAGESARILNLAGGGIAVPPEDPDALAEAVRRLAADPEGAAEMGRRGRLFAARRLRAVQAERLEQLLLEVVGADPAS
jgi:glycosyltransferase involved in cell wall biosynthesis